MRQAIAAITAYGPDCRHRLARRRYLRERPDQQVQTGERRLPEDRRDNCRPQAPDVFVQEGGYAVAEIGINAVGVLTGFEAG